MILDIMIERKRIEEEISDLSDKYGSLPALETRIIELKETTLRDHQERVIHIT
jgi:hypothetical protein